MHRDPGGEGHRSGSLGNTDCGEGHRDCFGGGSDPVYRRGEGTQKSPATCFEFSCFLILISEDSNNYFEIFLVLSKTQKTISGLPPFSPPPGLRPGSGLPGRAPQLMIGGARGEEEGEKEEEEENHTASHSGSGTK